MTLLQQIERDVKKLSVEEREHLIATTFEMLPAARRHEIAGNYFESDDDYEKECIAEAQRRAKESEEDPSTLMTWEEFRAAIKY